MKNADEILFRCHSLGDIMPSDKPKVLFTATQIDKMVEIYTDLVEGRREEIKSKYLTKGNAREEDSITLLSRVKQTFYKKNAERLNNAFLTGEVDMFDGESIEKAIETIDIKTSWSRVTFNKACVKELDRDYKLQGQGYMALTGAKKHTVAFCLVNGTEQAITDEKRKLSYVKGMSDTHGNPTPECIEKCKQIEINHIFDLKSFMDENPFFQFDNDISEWRWDIPMEKRVHTFTFEKDEAVIESIYKRIKECREWLNANMFK